LNKALLFKARQQCVYVTPHRSWFRISELRDHTLTHLVHSVTHRMQMLPHTRTCAIQSEIQFVLGAIKNRAIGEQL
jgi:hypothetical protein